MLSKGERDRVERRLREERERALVVIADFDAEFASSLSEASGELSAYRLHPADLGSDSMEREQRFLLASQESDRLYRIDRALSRLYDGDESFGKCGRCGKAISVERLALVPESELCADCQGEVERSKEGSER
jgi:DnaK suppressor protein